MVSLEVVLSQKISALLKKSRRLLSKMPGEKFPGLPVIGVRVKAFLLLLCMLFAAHCALHDFVE